MKSTIPDDSSPVCSNSRVSIFQFEFKSFIMRRILLSRAQQRTGTGDTGDEERRDQSPKFREASEHVTMHCCCQLMSPVLSTDGVSSHLLLSHILWWESAEMNGQQLTMEQLPRTAWRWHIRNIRFLWTLTTVPNTCRNTKASCIINYKTCHVTTYTCVHRLG